MRGGWGEMKFFVLQSVSCCQVELVRISINLNFFLSAEKNWYSVVSSGTALAGKKKARRERRVFLPAQKVKNQIFRAKVSTWNGTNSY